MLALRGTENDAAVSRKNSSTVTRLFSVPGESPGLVQPPSRWSGSSYGSIPIGMGVSVTPLQMAAVYATIANGGTYVAPHLIAGTIGPDGSRHPTQAPVRRTVLSQLKQNPHTRHIPQYVDDLPRAAAVRQRETRRRLAAAKHAAADLRPHGRVAGTVAHVGDCYRDALVRPPQSRRPHLSNPAP